MYFDSNGSLVNVLQNTKNLDSYVTFFLYLCAQLYNFTSLFGCPLWLNKLQINGLAFTRS